MIISLKKGTPQGEIDKLRQAFEGKGFSVSIIQGLNHNVFGIIGDTTSIDERMLLSNAYVDNVTRIAAPYKKANRLFHPEDTVI